MRIRNKLILAMAVPVTLLVIQILLVNVSIRELQSAINFISSAHKVIESDFVSLELVDSLRKEVKLLPSRYVSTQPDTNEDGSSIRPGWQNLTSHIDEISDSHAAKLIDPPIYDAVIRAFERVSIEYEKTETAIAAQGVDLDTLIERAIFVDKALEELSETLGFLAIELRKQLQIAVDRERQIHNRPVIAGIVMGGLAVVLLLAFTWLYVDRYFVTRLTGLSKSMLAIASGKLLTKLPKTSGNDEVSEMADALRIFRDTAVEVEENNLREIAEARQRLVDAINSISEGFSLYDKNDRLVLSNSRYKDLLYPGLQDSIQPGVLFTDVITNAANAGLIEHTTGQLDEWVAERLKQHKNPSGSFVQCRNNACWIEVTEHKTSDGGTVAIYADITDQKQSEMALRKEKKRTEEANEQVIQKNIMLESLSSKLSKYLSPQIYSSIFSGDKNVGITSERKKLTVMFSDIAGFTETADKLESEEFTDLLNNYLTEMSRIALEYGATIDKYIGDAIMIFFGDPETKGEKNDAIACVKMAIEMQRRMGELQEEWRNRGIQNPFQLRIGINTGYCTVGNFGSEDRMDYTIIGNQVNLAARLQSASGLGEILIAHETYALVNDALPAQEQPPVTVKGFGEPVRNYKIVDHVDDSGRPNKMIDITQNGIHVSLDLDNLTLKEKSETIESIRQTLSELMK